MSDADTHNGSEDQDGNSGPDVFLSYSRDDQPIARKVLEQLQAADISVWWDAMLEGGARFHQVTERNLELARAVVVLWSKTSTASHWVHDEATRGRDRGCLIPVSIDGTIPPLGFRQFQWIDLSQAQWEERDPNIAKLIDAVRAQADPAYDAQHDWTPLAQNLASSGGGHGVSQASALSEPHRSAGPVVSRRAAIVAGGAATLAAGGLIAWTTGLFGGASGEARVAVLPFSVTGQSQDQSHLVDGFATSIRSQLSRNPLLHVAARASSNSVDAASQSAREICGALGVDFLLTGNVRWDGDRLQVTGELSEGATDRLVLPLEFGASIDRVFEIQAQIASDVVAQLVDQDPAASASEDGGTQNVAAYDAFLRGRQLYESGIDEASDRGALAKFDEAIALDPDYAAAHAMRARTLALIGNLYGGKSERERDYADAASSAARAVDLAPDFADGHSVLGFVNSVSLLDMRAAKAPYDRAYELGAGDADILSRFAIFRARNGDFQRARDAISQASALDPLNARVFRFAGTIAYNSGQNGAAIENLERAHDLQPGISSYHYLTGLAQLARGDSNAAKTSFANERRFVFQQTGLAIVENTLGNREQAQIHLDQLKQRQGDKSNYQYIQIHTQWGDTPSALSALDAAWRERDPGLAQMLTDPLLDPLRDEPRFQAVVDEIGFG